MRYGVLGGTFNPIHYGHLRAAEEVREALSLDKVLFIPSGTPPLKSSDLADIEHRFAMAVMATASNSDFEVLDLEIRRAGKSFTVLTLEELGKAYPDSEFYFIMGIDTFSDLPKWREPEKLIAMVDFIVIRRPSYLFISLEHLPYLRVNRQELLKLDSGETDSVQVKLGSGKTAFLMNITEIDISATAIRKLVREGRSLRYLLPEDVESYIMTNGLFTGQV